jgi:hypothetical protein
MPKTLPALVAVAVIAFSIGFNVARYPIVWEMVGASGHLPDESSGANMAATPQPAKTDEVIASIPSDNPALTPLIEGQTQSTVISISDQATAVKKTGPEVAESSPGFVQLVAVPANLFKKTGWQNAEQYTGVQRLPPVYEEAPIPAGRYAAEYPQAPVTIYPSTGVE